MPHRPHRPAGHARGPAGCCKTLNGCTLPDSVPGGVLMKRYLIALAAVLSITALSTHQLTTHAFRSYTAAPPSVTVSVTPTRLTPLDRATIAATFSSDRPAAGP